MVENHNKGKRGNIIWAPTGSGKTLCVLRYMLAINMKEYCVYTLPASAMDSVKKEFDTHKIKYQTIDVNTKPLSGTNKIILPNIVNFIEHDQVKKESIASQLRNHSGNMLFIVDEFHKALATTIRTSVILEIVSLCSEFIAMSGTIIKDENHEELIQWLIHIVNFPVTVHNYWVAIGALISKKFSTGITVERQEIEAEIEDLEAYKLTVPEGVGGSARNINLPEALRLCYKSITKVMVDITKQYIEVGEGLFIVAKDSKHQQELYNLLSPWV
jgi:superfamily II DNA or RNA helicase